MQNKDFNKSGIKIYHVHLAKHASISYILGVVPWALIEKYGIILNMHYIVSDIKTKKGILARRASESFGMFQDIACSMSRQVK